MYGKHFQWNSRVPNFIKIRSVVHSLRTNNQMEYQMSWRVKKKPKNMIRRTSAQIEGNNISSEIKFRYSVIQTQGARIAKSEISEFNSLFSTALLWNGCRLLPFPHMFQWGGTLTTTTETLHFYKIIHWVTSTCVLVMFPARLSIGPWDSLWWRRCFADSAHLSYGPAPPRRLATTARLVTSCTWQRASCTQWRPEFSRGEYWSWGRGWLEVRPATLL